MKLEFDKYSFLWELDLKENLSGIINQDDNEQASGEWVLTMNPHNDEPIS